MYILIHTYTHTYTFHFLSFPFLISIDCADDDFQESLGLFDWDLNLERSSPVFALPLSPGMITNV